MTRVDPMRRTTFEIFAACVVACGLTLGCGSPAPEDNSGNADTHVADTYVSDDKKGSGDKPAAE